MNQIVFMLLEDVLLLHKKVMERFDSKIALVRDRGLLESAVAQAQASAFGEYLHKDIYEMAAAYCYHIIKNHPFVDGNKRTGLLTALTFLAKNGIEINATFDELYIFALDVASSKISKEAIAKFFMNHSVIA